MQKNILLGAGASKNFDNFGSSFTQHQNLAPAPAPTSPRLAGFIALGSGSGSGSPALVIIRMSKQLLKTNLNILAVAHQDLLPTMLKSNVMYDYSCQ